MTATRPGHPVFARTLAWGSPLLERAGMATHRHDLLAGLRGDVLEVGIGSGPSFDAYPDTVRTLVGVEPEPYLRRRATERASQLALGFPVEVVDGRGEDLPLDDDCVDAAVVVLVLCSVQDQLRTLAEIARVLRPGGELRFLEHVVAGSRVLRRVQRVADATLWPRLAGGCRTSRDTLGAIHSSGFTVRELSRFRFPDRRPSLPSSPHVAGVAVSPSRARARVR